MRLDRRIIGSIAVLLTIGVSVVCMNYHSRLHTEPGDNFYIEPLTPAPPSETPLKGIRDDFTLDASFTSHLPIVVINTNNERPPITTRLLEEERRYVVLEGVEPYVQGSIAIIDNQNGINSLGDAATSTHRIRLKRRGNSSMGYDKAQYLLKLVTESQQEALAPLLGMGEESEWVLNGNMADKTMVRNFVSYRIISDIIPFTPDTRFCEVVYYENGQYVYEGVYLLMENVKQGEHRVNIPDYKPNDTFPSYIVRRDRFDETAVTLNTYGTKNKLCAGYLEIYYPGAKFITDELISYIENDISKIEKVLYSDSFSEFSTYPRYIDVDSFIDYFLINEFFGNYDAGAYSTYMYKTGPGKLKIGPVWDYDNAYDNARAEALNTEVTALQIKPWFDRLTKDSRFMTQLEKRYSELRAGPLSDENVITTINQALEHLGPALDREWTRWGKIYGENNKWSLQSFIDADGYVINRNTNELRQELYRLNTSIVKHGQAIGPRLNLLQSSTETTTGLFSRMDIVFFAALLLFALPCLFVARK